MKLIDVVMLRDELSMLHVRLAELDDLVDRFVIVESACTHRGDPKPLFYAAHKEQFAPWADKITHVITQLPPRVGSGPDPVNPWSREHAQRDAALQGLADADDDDVILVSDVDEFPPAGFDYTSVDGPVAFRQRLAMYAVDWLYPELHICTVAAKVGHVRQHGLAATRDGRYNYPQTDGGWHLTWLGGVTGQRAKLSVICHLEMTAYEASLLYDGRCYNEGIHHSGQLQMIGVDVDETWPEAIWKREVPASWFRPR